MEDHKETVLSRHTRADTHMNSAVETAWANPVQAQARAGPAWRGALGMEPHPSRGAISNWQLLGKRETVFSKRTDPEKSTTL